jgi:hypothetical protein
MARTALRTVWLWGLCGTLAIAVPARGQQNRPVNRTNPGTEPFLANITPPAVSPGKTAEWTVTGRNLKKVERLLISGAGVEMVSLKAESETNARVVVRADDKAEPGYREVRAVGPHGLSNLALVRIDRLEQVKESEPNDDPARANPVTVGSAVVGVLKPQDLDHYRIEGKAGRRLTMEVEAQRLGTPIVPVLTIMTPSGAALAQARESRGTDHDCRLTYTFPADGTYILQVRDNIFAGGDAATYRLRLEEGAYATALFPLGGPKGQSTRVVASGGNLSHPLVKTITLPDTPGALIELGSFDGPGGPVLAPGMLFVGDGPDNIEAPGASAPISSSPLDCVK